MIRNLISFALQQRVFVILIALAIVIFGLFALSDLPIEAFPDVQDVQVQVITLYPGQAPEEVERSVSLPIEREMSGVPRMTQMRSVSMTGLSIVTLIFSDGTNDYFARQQVLEKLGTVNLPANVQSSLAPLSTAVGEVYRYVLQAPDDMPRYEVRALQDWVIRPRLKIVQGVADVISFGGTIKEYQVRVNPYALKRFGLTIDRVSDALGANSANTSGGILRRGDEGMVIRGVGLFRQLEDISRVIVESRGGKPILVSDLAEVEIGERVRSGIVGFNDRDDVVEGIVQMIKGQDPAKIIVELLPKVDEINAMLPPGVKITPIYRRTELIRNTVRTVSENLLVGAFLVIGILLLFLRNWRAALIVATVIPLSLLFAFILLDARGISANLISLGAIDFGIIVDSAVVVVEALMVKIAVGQAEHDPAHRGYEWRFRALRSTANELGRPILFSKAIIITAFLPIFTFQRVEGKIFAPLTYTLSFALLGAIFLTLTLVPTLLSYSLRSEAMSERPSPWMHALQDRYRRVLEWGSGNRLIFVLSSVAVLVASFGLLPLLGSEFLPKLDEGNIWLSAALPPSTALEKTKDIERQVRAILQSYPEVNNIVSQVGRPEDGTDPKGPNNLEFLADLKPRSTWRFPSKEKMVDDMAARMRSLPGVPTNFSQVIEDNVQETLSGVRGEIAVKVFGPDLAILEEKSQQIADILSGIRGSADVAAIRIGGQTEVDIDIDRQRIARLGINVADVNTAIQTALAGTPVNVFFDGNRRFDVTVRLQQRYRDAVDDIATVQVPLPNGAGTVALQDISHIEIRQGASRVAREGGMRNANIKANLRGRDQGSFVAEAQRKVRQQVNLPRDYTITWGGQFENQQRAVKRLQVIIPISVLIIFSLLFWAFRSIRKSVLVLLMVPFTLIGGFAGLALAGLNLSISAAVGFIAVAGISVQNGVIMVEQIVELIKTSKTLQEAVLEGAVLRMRPILMTALMAGLGLLPAALSHGIGSETQRPFAVVIVGGIVTATLFTLLLLPVVFRYFAKEIESPA
jgi:heavy metal efflux system protein